MQYWYITFLYHSECEGHVLFDTRLRTYAGIGSLLRRPSSHH
jgi:hypothetical protein